MSKSSLEAAWRRQKEWSGVAQQFKSSLTFWRRLVLILAIVAAAFGIGSTYMEGILYWIFTGVAAISTALLPLIVKSRLNQKNVENWIRARSASESYKSEIFLYRTSIGDYEKTNRSEKLISAFKLIDSSVEDILITRLQPVVIEENMMTDLSIEEYLQIRVKSQVETYYISKSIFHAKLANNYRNIQFYFMLATAVLAALSAVAEVGLGIWIGVATTIFTSITAHIEAGRHDYLALSFRATANRLEEIIIFWNDLEDNLKNSIEEKTKVVMRCEEAIAVENQSWQAKFLSPMKS